MRQSSESSWHSAWLRVTAQSVLANIAVIVIKISIHSVQHMEIQYNI